MKTSLDPLAARAGGCRPGSSNSCSILSLTRRDAIPERLENWKFSTGYCFPSSPPTLNRRGHRPEFVSNSSVHGHRVPAIDPGTDARGRRAHSYDEASGQTGLDWRPVARSCTCVWVDRLPESTGKGTQFTGFSAATGRAPPFFLADVSPRPVERVSPTGRKRYWWSRRTGPSNLFDRSAPEVWATRLIAPTAKIAERVHRGACRGCDRSDLNAMCTMPR